jgi:hypothetical protein
MQEISGTAGELLVSKEELHREVSGLSKASCLKQISKK